MSFVDEFTRFIDENEVSGNFVPVPVCATSREEAIVQQASLAQLVGKVSFVTEDRWRSRPLQTRARILSHAGMFMQVYARNCEVRRIDKPTAAAFLQDAHGYGDALCRYRYGLFVRHLTGEKSYSGHLPLPSLTQGSLVAVAEFSNMRNMEMLPDGHRRRSCQWIRYASLPGVRVEGGMGKVLHALVGDADPDDVMTYADLEWSDGKAYRALGFDYIDLRAPVMFRVDPVSWERHAIGAASDAIASAAEPKEDMLLWWMNFGSVRYRLDIKKLF